MNTWNKLRKRSLRKKQSVHQASHRTTLQEENESDFSSVSTYTSTSINEEFAMKGLKMNADEFNKKMELGKISAKLSKIRKYHKIACVEKTVKLWIVFGIKAINEYRQCYTIHMAKCSAQIYET